MRALGWGLVLGLGIGAGSAGEAAKDTVFKLREKSVFDVNDADFIRGQRGECQEKPFADVKAYPAFKSAKPIYGSVRFAAPYNETNASVGMLFYFAADESGGTAKGYDRLYFDLNRDLDLRNDPVLKPHKSPPTEARLRYSSIKQQAIFELFSVNFDFGPAGTRPVEILPRLTISTYEGDTNEYKQVTFGRTRLYEGEIKLGGQSYNARLGNDYVIFGRLDGPQTTLKLMPKGSSLREISWWGGDRLCAVHKFGGQFYTFAATPTGDELRVRPYTGELGRFEIGAGGRKVDTLTARGSLRGADKNVAVGDLKENDGSPEAVSRCELPAGDYLPSYLSIRLGRLEVDVSDNYHSDGKPRDRAGRPLVYGMTIRKDKPFVLDFSNPPDVMFALPAKDQRVKLGDELMVKAVLVDSKLDIMIRGLDDTTRKTKTGRDGKPMSYERNLSLDPTVIITRTNGEKVAEGVMPFG